MQWDEDKVFIHELRFLHTINLRAIGTKYNKPDICKWPPGDTYIDVKRTDGMTKDSWTTIIRLKRTPKGSNESSSKSYSSKILSLPKLDKWLLIYSSSISAVSPDQNNNGLRRCLHTCACPQCLLRRSAGFWLPGIYKNVTNLDAITSRTLWKESAVCRLCSLASGRVELPTTDSLSPNMKLVPRIGTPR